MLSVASSRTCGYDPASFALSCALVTIMSSVASVSCADGLSSAWPVASEGAGPVGQVEDQGDVVQRHDLPRFGRGGYAAGWQYRESGRGCLLEAISVPPRCTCRTGPRLSPRTCCGISAPPSYLGGMTGILLP